MPEAINMEMKQNKLQVNLFSNRKKFFSLLAHTTSTSGFTDPDNCVLDSKEIWKMPVISNFIIWKGMTTKSQPQKAGLKLQWVCFSYICNFQPATEALKKYGTFWPIPAGWLLVIDGSNPPPRPNVLLVSTHLMKSSLKLNPNMLILKLAQNTKWGRTG